MVRVAQQNALATAEAARGEGNAMQIATIVGENKVKVVPDIAVAGDGSSGLVNVMLGRMLAATPPASEPPKQF
jgi:hypothetical protein